MKLYAALETNEHSGTPMLVSLTKKLPKGDNVFTLHMDDDLTGNYRKWEARTQLTKLLGQRVNVDWYKG